MATAAIARTALHIHGFIRCILAVYRPLGRCSARRAGYFAADLGPRHHRQRRPQEKLLSLFVQ
jgi:hypothetical protein